MTSPKTYRRRSPRVRAIQYDGSEESLDAIRYLVESAGGGVKPTPYGFLLAGVKVYNNAPCRIYPDDWVCVIDDKTIDAFSDKDFRAEFEEVSESPAPR